MAYCPKQLADFLDGVVGVVDANSYESMKLWEENKEWGKREWVQNNAGLTEIIGHLDDRPVNLSLFTNEVGGWKLLFIDCISQVVDHKMIDDWLVKNLPATAFRKEKCVNRTNAMNFSNVFPRMNRITIRIG